MREILSDGIQFQNEFWRKIIFHQWRMEEVYVVRGETWRYKIVIWFQNKTHLIEIQWIACKITHLRFIFLNLKWNQSVKCMIISTNFRRVDIWIQPLLKIHTRMEIKRKKIMITMKKIDVRSLGFIIWWKNC